MEDKKFSIRLQVFLSRNGVCSRRKAMDLVKDGHVTVNGKKTVEPSTPVLSGKDRICVDGKCVVGNVHEYILMNKPMGVTTTKSDKFAKKSVIDLLPKELRHIHPVGRLDKDTEGLLLLTNDGDLTYKLTHPKHHVDKTYFVKMSGVLNQAEKKKLENGVYVEGKKTAPAKIKDVKIFQGYTDFLIIIHEGRKRQIRMMIKAVKRKVIYLKRVSIGPLKLGGMKIGSWRSLSEKEVDKLKQ